MNNQITRLVLFLFICVNTLISATTGKISGHVTDSESGEPLIGVNIFISNLGTGAATDIDGYYAILNVRPGKHELRASMIGYAPLVMQNVDVVMGLTSTIDLSMSSEILGMEAVTVISERPIVAKDLSGSQLNVDSESIQQWPISSVDAVLGVQAGVENMQVRGGSISQTAVMVDGFLSNDSRSNAPVTTLSLSSVEEIQVQSGGFNAEYGNIRSGIVNIVTAEGPADHYSASFYYQNSPAAPKHYGISPYDEESYFMRPYLDDDVAWTGTGSGGWDAYTQDQYPNFEGWNSYNNPETGMTATAAQQEWIYEHRRTGEITKPDQTLDMGFGGPIPGISKLRFYLSVRNENEQFIVPLSRDGYSSNSTRLKLNYDLSTNQKLVATMLYSEEHSVNRYNWTTVPEGNLLRGTYSVANLVTSAGLFTPAYYSPYSVFRGRFDVSYNHMLSSDSYYEIIIQHGQTQYQTYEMDARDTTKLEIFPGFYHDESPYGYNSADWMSLGRDTSHTSSTLLKADYTDQINSSNQIKMGVQANFYDLQIRSYTESDKDTWSRTMNYDVTPIRLSGYVQDKLEFEGFIANLGLRAEFSSANTDVYELNAYDDLFKQGLGSNLEELAEKQDAKSTFTLSPRLGISHPITDHSKLYFNYGHFYSEAGSTYRFRLQRESNGLVTNLGNPELEQERTIAYELGYSHGFSNTYILDLATYYKDITQQPGWVIYKNATGSVNYRKAESNNYQDIRGVEITLSKPKGRIFSGFINYTYMVTTNGYFGLLRQFQNPQEQRDYENYNVVDSKPRAQPYFRANLSMKTPDKFGPSLAGMYPAEGFELSFLASSKTGLEFLYKSPEAGDVFIQWMSQWDVDLRIQKAISAGGLTLVAFCDIDNLLDNKVLSYSGFSDQFDYADYLSSLNFYFEEGINHGDDYVGVYREDDIAYDPLVPNPDNDPQIAADNERRRESKSYIDMPNYRSLTFLNPRQFTFGLRFNF
ncbi:MAG: TonB-dependent receptor [Candidatus Marinimicrobia bacterium]|jgi:outer membrane receptor protein involved in Fe transport|nr:TonB-dependent receptor [Candidatus Neomarinimicrobiota bacterium]MBT3574788.1 TonB-dependent receptor [Candidatus Neomarinimicrobiota bacterium]MBT3681174.1 TonB-dependent receptor [Candidatus Neomarinimicrobiota bacterium]MBT3950167.1 TonB-dependent receptor [Candidatus Neomarinimicrobiota bacterium]MBT4254103.1 TonB-dependent receptor [Candidatus Neomarinimicrobiota bacterium]